MSYIGSTPTTQSFIAGTDSFNGTGSATNFTLSRFVNSVNDVQVVVNNVVQYPPNYSVSGNTLTISPAPSAGTNNVYVRYLSTTLQSIAPSQGIGIQFGIGSLALPSISFIGDPNTGIYSPAADTIAFVEGGTEAMRIDSSANVGIGTTSPVTKLDVTGIATVRNNSAAFNTTPNTNYGLNFQASSSGTTYITSYSSGGSTDIAFATNSGGGAAAERARIDSSGRVLINTTSPDNNYQVKIDGSAATRSPLRCSMDSTSNLTQVGFFNPNGAVGSISTSGSATAYNTSSDYRLKESITPMTGALAKVSLLKPVTYKWKVDGSDGQGFIAHELAEVEAGCVNGEKDAVDADGNPVYQGIDTSFLVATLTAAIQEQQAMIDTIKQEIAELKAKVGE
jgi:hypothetical protein